MKVKISIPEVINIFKEIQQPEKLFEKIRAGIRGRIGVVDLIPD